MSRVARKSGDYSRGHKFEASSNLKHAQGLKTKTDMPMHVEKQGSK